MLKVSVDYNWFYIIIIIYLLFLTIYWKVEKKTCIQLEQNEEEI